MREKLTKIKIKERNIPLERKKLRKVRDEMLLFYSLTADYILLFFCIGWKNTGNTSPKSRLFQST